MNCKKIMCGVLAAITILSFAGCAGQNGTNETNGTTEPSASASQDGSDALLSDMFTSRDIEVGYDENTDTVITLADGKSSCKNTSVKISGDNITLTQEGTYIFKGTLSDGSITVDAEKSAKLHIVFAGVSISKSTTAAFYVKQADKVFVTLAPGTENTLSNTGEFTAIDDNNIDSCIFSKDDITFNGSGNLNVTSENGHGIVSKDTLCFTGGTYTVNAERHALSAKDDIRVMDGTFDLTSVSKDGLNADNDEDETLGFIYIENGEFTISAGDDGMHAGSSLRILGGNITVTKSYEGLEGNTVEISGGTISVKASDDGINAAGGTTSANDPMATDENAYVRISGGSVTVDADGDGIDSNGALYVLGGTVTVFGPTSGADGALDYGERATAKISGGTVFAFGSASMAENFNAAENQGAALVSLSGNAGDTVTISSSDGEKLASASPTKKYECVVVSCTGMSENGSYTLTNGTTDKTFTLSGLLYGESGMGMGGGMGGFGGKDNGRQPFGEMPTNENGEVEMPGGGQGMPDGERREPPTDENGNMQKPSGGNAADGNGQNASNGSSQTASA